MGLDAIDIVHHHPLVLADALPHVRGLTTFRLCIDLFGVVVVEMVDFVRDHILDAAWILLSHVSHEVTAVGHRTDIGVEHLDLLVGVFKEQLGFGLQSREIFVGIAII